MIVLVWLAAWDKSLVYFSFCYSNHEGFQRPQEFLIGPAFEMETWVKPKTCRTLSITFGWLAGLGGCPTTPLLFTSTCALLASSVTTCTFCFMKSSRWSFDPKVGEPFLPRDPKEEEMKITCQSWHLDTLPFYITFYTLVRNQLF